MQVSVGIPTIGRVEMLNSVLMGVFNNRSYISEVVILDEADTPIMESYQVNQAIDLLSIHDIPVKIIRNRNRKGIGAARIRLAEECKSENILMIDDDVVIDRFMIHQLYAVLEAHDVPWVVPYCMLIPKISLDGYSTKEVARDNPEVIKWVDKYPWFLPYFNFDSDFSEELEVSGTQAILLNKDKFLKTCGKMANWGNIPREDTYMTKMMGYGMFVSRAICYHFEHISQQERHWDSSMFYRVHELIMSNPKDWEKIQESLI